MLKKSALLRRVKLDFPLSIKSIKMGFEDLFALTYEGFVYKVFLNESLNDISWRKIDIPEPVKKIACGEFHFLALTENGRVWGLGGNLYGELGLSSFNLGTDTPTIISLPIKEAAASIAAGSYHSLILMEDGSLLGLGCSFYGQLGVREQNFQLKPRLIKFSDKSIIDINAKNNYSVAFCHDYSLWIWGSLFDTNSKGTYSPVKIDLSDFGDLHSLSCSDDYPVILGTKSQLGLIDYENGFCINPLESDHINSSFWGDLSIQDICFFGNNLILVDGEGNIWGHGPYFGNDLNRAKKLNLALPFKKRIKSAMSFDALLN